jgi:hypothetical protein
MTSLEEIERCAQVVDRYLERFPRAADTIDGIHTWWLDDRASDVSRAVLQAALDLLLAQGRIVKSALPDGAEVYRAKRTDAAGQS